MYCVHCSAPLPEENAAICPQCGAQQPQRQSPVLVALRDKLFLVLCILISAGSVFAVLGETFPVFGVLLAALLWTVFIKIRSGENPTAMLRCVSGTVFANYVVNYVGCGLFVVLGLASVAIPQKIADSLAESLGKEVSKLIVQHGEIVGIALLVIFLLVAAIILLINIFAIRKFHALAKSAYQSINAPSVPLASVRAVRVWLWIEGVLCVLTVLDSVGSFAFFGGLCDGAAAIVAALLVQKHLIARA